MNTWLPEASLLIRSLGWTLLYSLAQGLLVYSCLRIILSIVAPTNARIRYNISVAACSLLFLWFISTWIQQWQQLLGTRITVTQYGLDPQTTKTYYINTTNAYNTGSSISSILYQLENYFPILVSLYIAGITFLIIRFSYNIIQLQQLKYKGITIPDNKWHSLVTNIQEKLAILQKVQLFFSENVNVPMVIGIIKPIILLPIATISELSIDQIEAILIHEMAHIKRHDFLVNILQTIVETILFFNPFIWLVSSIIRREREHCCDDMVVNNSSQPLLYAKALATLETYRLSSNYPIAMAATGNKQQLFHRIKRIMEMKKDRLSYSKLFIAIVAVTTIIVSVACFTPGFAQSQKKKKDTKTSESTKSIKKEKIIIMDDDGNTTEYNSVEELPADVKKKLKRELDNSPSHSKSHSKTDDSAVVIIKKALKDVDWDEIGRSVDKAIKEVDWTKVNVDVDKIMKDVDWDEINHEIKKGIAESDEKFNDPDVREEIRIALNKAEKETKRAMKEVKIAVADAHSKNKPNSHEIDRDNPDHDIMAMVDKMDRDGLIDENEGYKIYKRGNTLYINDEEQPSSVYNKYSQYFKHRKVRVIKRGDGLTIDIND